MTRRNAIGKKHAALAAIPRELKLPPVFSNGWIGLFGPAGMPDDLVALFHKEVSAALADTSVREKFGSLGLIVAPSTPSEMKARVEVDLKKLKPIIEKRCSAGPTR